MCDFIRHRKNWPWYSVSDHLYFKSMSSKIRTANIIYLDNRLNNHIVVKSLLIYVSLPKNSEETDALYIAPHCSSWKWSLNNEPGTQIQYWRLSVTQIGSNLGNASDCMVEIKRTISSSHSEELYSVLYIIHLIIIIAPPPSKRVLSQEAQSRGSIDHWRVLWVMFSGILTDWRVKWEVYHTDCVTRALTRVSGNSRKGVWDNDDVKYYFVLYQSREDSLW